MVRTHHVTTVLLARALRRGRVRCEPVEPVLVVHLRSVRHVLQIALDEELLTAVAGQVPRLYVASLGIAYRPTCVSENITDFPCGKRRTRGRQKHPVEDFYSLTS